MKPLVITLDGPSGSGKSTASKRLAQYFDVPCLDTGAMYRTVAYKALQNKINLADEEAVANLARSLHFDFGFEGNIPWVAVQESDGKSWRAGKEIRTPEISMAASAVAKLPKVRGVLVEKQQEIGGRRGAIVEGRDAGTVIFPRATVKFFVTATPEERAKRRHKELVEIHGLKGQSYQDVLKEIIIRDKQDEERSASPSKPAEDAQIIDTSGLDLEAVVQLLIDRTQAALKAF